MKMTVECATALPYTPQTFHRGSLRGLGHPQVLPVLQALLQQCLCADAAAVVYRTHPHRVWTVGLPVAVSPQVSFLVVKQFGWRTPLQYLMSPWRASKAWKAYRTACHLLSHHLPTPLPLGVGEKRVGGFVRDNVYLTAALPVCISLQDYVQTGSAETLSEVMRQTAAYVRQMHDSGLVHRDLNLENFLLHGAPLHYTLYLIDLNRAWRLPFVPLWLRAIDLARLCWPVAETQFYAYYCAGDGRVKQLLQMVCLYRFWRLWRRRFLAVLRPWRARQGVVEHPDHS